MPVPFTVKALPHYAVTYLQGGVCKEVHTGTTLHWAANGFNIHSPIDLPPRVRWLVEKGADTEIKDEKE
jgi:hypothetical protein